MSTLFISHSSQDDAFVRDLRAVLADHGQDGWIDSRELRGGDPLWPEIQRAIEAASAYTIVISTDALQSKWVGKELRHALEVQQQRGTGTFPVIPLSLNDTKLGVLEEYFGEEPVYLPISSQAGGVEAAMDAILVALGKRRPADVPATPQPKAEPLEDLVLELTDLTIYEQDGIRRAAAHAQLVYEPAALGQRTVASTQKWQFVAPLGPIEAEDLRWYLEKYAVWPSTYFRDRAQKVEADLVKWGQLLHKAAMPVAHTANVMQAWATIGDQVGRRFSIHVDPTLVAGTSEADVATAREAATLLQSLPWELLHDGDGYLFQGAKPTRVRRRLPNTKILDVPVVTTPIRILLVTARPEDDACSYIDHRVSALPLVEAMEALPGLVEIHVLSPPTFPAMRAELERARREQHPYHVVHFDGHGVYNRAVGLGGLCFEQPEDTGELEKRRHATVFTDKLGPLLRDYRIPLVFLEACQTAQAEKASESVASELLKVGVASVVAMSHSVLVETARRFVEAFYQGLAASQRVGEAMLAGQRHLKDDTFRGRIFGAGELRLEDWFVPVLFQEKDDPQLFTTRPAQQTKDDFQSALESRLGNLPPQPETDFIGRSRDLLALQHLLRPEGGARYAVVRGQGGEGKTALAAEFAHWMVRSHQMRRTAFVSVEGLEKNLAESILDQLGQQLLLKPNFSTQADCHGELDQVEKEVVRLLREQPTLLIIDNMESILLPPFVEEETPEALSQEAREEVTALLALSERLLKVGETRLIFTSREPLPTPFSAERQRRELHRLDRKDAVKLVERVLNAGGGDAGTSSEAAGEQIEQLVDAVHGHARTLGLLAPSLRERGVEATRASLVKLMTDMEQQFPGNREHSLFASVELSLQRMSDANRERTRVLGVFHGGVSLTVLHMMMQWEKADVETFGVELLATGLATPNRYSHLTLNPALCPYLRGKMDAAELETLTARWGEAMLKYAKYLEKQRSQNIEVAATLTLLELPNLFALLDLVQRADDPEATINLTTSLYNLLQRLGKPRLLKRVGQVRDKAAATLGDAWSHAQFDATLTRIQQQLNTGQLREALEGAQQLLQRTQAAGGQAYPSADYDLAMAFLLLARVLRLAGQAEQALPLLDEARPRFEAVAKERSSKAAEGSASICLTEQGDCLRKLGRLDKAAIAYEEAIRLDEQHGSNRDVAVGKGQLGTVRLFQKRYSDALEAYTEARENFTQLDEPGSLAVIWHQTGMVYHDAGQPEAAEDAYRKALAIKVRLGDDAGQASTLGELGNLYDDALGRTEEAVTFYRQAVEKFLEIGDVAGEGRQRNNLAIGLLKLRRFDDARQEIRQTIKCDAQFRHEAEPWKTWATLADIERHTGNPSAAAEAKRKATACYLAYRLDGGENQNAEDLLFQNVTQAIQTGERGKADEILATYRQTWKGHENPEADVLQAIIDGSRDRTLADAPDLTYAMAAEILLLIETLENPQT